MMPPRQSTSESAADAAKDVVAINSERKCMARTLILRISEVRVSNSRSILSSSTRDLTVGAPVMPSLKAPVMREFCSRTCRWSTTSLRWK